MKYDYIQINLLADPGVSVEPSRPELLGMVFLFNVRH
jgi:hypothetical protein